jgi:tetratricopeptide (TPR) repeat protein
MSRFAAVTERLIHKCQQDYQTGRNLGQSAPSLSREQVALIVAESLEADGLLRLPREELTDLARQGAANDWSLAVLAEIHFAWAEDETGDATDIFVAARRDGYIEVAYTALEHALNSPTASPLLWYEEIFFEVAQRYRRQNNERALEIMRRGLRHNLTFNNGNNAINFLRDLTDLHLSLSQLDEALMLLAHLLRHNPADIWTYNLMALRFGQHGLPRLGEQAARHGLELLETLDMRDKESLQKQLADALTRLQQAQQTAEVAPALLAEVEASLALPFDAGSTQPVAELCRQLLPNLNLLPVKAPPVAPALPGITAAPKLNRNDPCWCGSGKKYKHCHQKADRPGSSR